MEEADGKAVLREQTTTVLKCYQCLIFDLATALNAITVAGGQALCAIHFRAYLDEVR